MQLHVLVCAFVSCAFTKVDKLRRSYLGSGKSFNFSTLFSGMGTMEAAGALVWNALILCESANQHLIPAAPRQVASSNEKCVAFVCGN